MGNSKSNKSQCKILIVDDDASILDLLTEVFSMEGYETYHAMNGKEGLRWIKKMDFGIVISDCQMPYMTGLEMHEKAKKLKPGIEKRVVFMTSELDGEESQALARETGAEVVTKPFLIKEIQEAVKKLLSNSEKP